jgi:hypothetical protein
VLIIQENRLPLYRIEQIEIPPFWLHEISERRGGGEVTQQGKWRRETTVIIGLKKVFCSNVTAV